MYCNFCGKNFEATEGFEEVYRHAHHLIRCEECISHQVEEEYDWRAAFGEREQSASDKASPRGQRKKGRH